MRFFRNLQFAQVRQTTRKTLVALAFMLVMLGSMFSVSAFAQAPTAFAAPARVDVVQIPASGCRPSFPSDAIFTWYNSLYQAWIRPLEYGDKHFNFAIQFCGSGGPGSYVINAHISYIGNSLWQTYDSVSGQTLNWGTAGGYLCSSWYQATYDITEYVAYKIGTGNYDLYTKSLDTVGEQMNMQIGGVC